MELLIQKKGIIDFTSDFIVSKIIVQKGKIVYEKTSEYLTKWNKRRFQFNRIHKKDSDLIDTIQDFLPDIDLDRTNFQSSNSNLL